MAAYFLTVALLVAALQTSAQAGTAEFGGNDKPYPSKKPIGQLSEDQKWIVLASLESLNAATAFARQLSSIRTDVRIFRAENNRYTVVVGPVTSTAAQGIRDDLLQRGFPADAYASSGGRFVEDVTRSAQSLVRSQSTDAIATPVERPDSQERSSPSADETFRYIQSKMFGFSFLNQRAAPTESRCRRSVRRFDWISQAIVYELAEECHAVISYEPGQGVTYGIETTIRTVKIDLRYKLLRFQLSNLSNGEYLFDVYCEGNCVKEMVGSRVYYSASTGTHPFTIYLIMDDMELRRINRALTHFRTFNSSGTIRKELFD